MHAIHQTVLVHSECYLSLDTCIPPTVSRSYAYNTIYSPGLVTMKFLGVLTRYKTYNDSAASGQLCILHYMEKCQRHKHL